MLKNKQHNMVLFGLDLFIAPSCGLLFLKKNWCSVIFTLTEVVFRIQIQVEYWKNLSGGKTNLFSEVLIAEGNIFS